MGYRGLAWGAMAWVAQPTSPSGLYPDDRATSADLAPDHVDQPGDITLPLETSTTRRHGPRAIPLSERHRANRGNDILLLRFFH